MTWFVDLDTMEICTRTFLTKVKCPGLIVKRLDIPLSDGDLVRLNAARLDESAPIGYRGTGKAVPVDGIYYREYVDQTPAEAAKQRLADLAATDSGMTRTEEDIIDTLDRLGIMPKTELPQSTQDRHADKKSKRAAL